MKIIDFEKKGNVVRFYLGDDNLKDWYGDDWNDTPYEHNAGTVYPEFVSDYIDVAFNLDTLLFEPCDGEYNSPFSKDDMKARRVPCIVVYDNNDCPAFVYRYSQIAGDDNSTKIYFGDDMNILSTIGTILPKQKQ